MSLTEKERSLVALALLGVVDRQATTPELAPIVVALASKLGVLAELVHHAKSWLTHATAEKARGSQVWALAALAQQEVRHEA